jgi:hypothetical protein
MIYEAAAALPYVDRERATRGLRGQLRARAANDAATPDWTTLKVDGPSEAPGLHGRFWYEWTAVVHADLADNA